MDKFDGLFKEEIKKIFSVPTFTAGLLRKNLKKEGVTLTDEQVEQFTAIFAQLEKDGELGEGLNFIINNDGKVNIVPEHSGSEIVVELADGADEAIDAVLNRLPEMITDLATTIGHDVLESLRGNARQMIREHTSIQRGFEKQLYRKWKKPLQLMETFLVIAEEAGAEYNGFISETTDITKAYRFEVLRRLHARACQVTKEVLALMKSGFADGAHARWRTLHEIAVITNFISCHDDDLAERYLLYQYVERYKAAIEFQEHCSDLGYEPLDEKVIDELKNRYNQLISRYGSVFKENYGWAAKVLPIGKRNLGEIEKEMDLKHMRPFYRLACLNVHAGPRGILFRLGLSDDQKNKILLSGSSDMGLADPGQNAIYSLLLATSNFLTYEPTLDCLVVLNTLMELEQEIFTAFDSVGDKYSPINPV